MGNENTKRITESKIHCKNLSNDREIQQVAAKFGRVLEIMRSHAKNPLVPKLSFEEK